MRSNIRLGHIFGIEIGLNYSWFFIAVLITTSLVEEFQSTHPEWGQQMIIAAAVLTALLFFGTLLAHELSHAMMARRFGIATRSITLFALGGVAQIESDATEARAEFWIGIIGPISSALIAVGCFAIAYLLGWRMGHTPDSPRTAILSWLGYINLWLAAFNMIPGFPLDGGRILRAVVWWISGDVVRSTRIASRIGQGVAVCFMGLGVYRYAMGAGFGGLWISFIGWYLFQAARSSFANVAIVANLQKLRVSDIMSRDCARISAYENLQKVMEEDFARNERRCFVIERNGETVGILGPEEIRSVERKKWPYTTVDMAMRSITELSSVDPATPVLQALEQMGREHVNQLPVMSNSHLEGIISRGNVVAFLQARGTGS